MTCSGSVSTHLWCRRYKDCIHLLTALAEITALLCQDNGACVDLCCSHASGMSVHFSSKFIQDIQRGENDRLLVQVTTEGVFYIKGYDINMEEIQTIAS